MADDERLSAKQVVERVAGMKKTFAKRDLRQWKLRAIRNGDYEAVAPGIFPDEFDEAMVANLVDTAAQDIADMLAPMPSISCVSLNLSNETQTKFANKRSLIAKSYAQRSRLQAQRYAGAERYASYGHMAYIVEPSFEDSSPIVRVETTPSVYYRLDRLGRTKQYASCKKMSIDDICLLFPDMEETIRNGIRAKYHDPKNYDGEVISWYDEHCRSVILADCNLELSYVPNPIGRCPVAVVEAPSFDGETHGQFDGVLGIQVARALTQFYAFSAMEQAVNAPVIAPDDLNEIEMGPMQILRTNNPAGVGRLQLPIPQGVFPEAQMLQQEQLMGSRYPQSRSGNIQASVITGQGIEALNGAMNSEIQTFQVLDKIAMSDAISMAFEMDQAMWPNTSKTFRIHDSGSPYEVTYTAAKDIKNDYTCLVSYGAIAGLDPNRALVFLLQANAGGLMSKATVRQNLPVDIDPLAEARQIDVEMMEGALAASVAGLAQTLPMMASQGQDPRQIVTQLAEVLDLRRDGASIEDAAKKVFAPPLPEGGEEPPEDPLAALMGGAGGGAPRSPSQTLLMSLAGMTPGGRPNLQSTVSRQTPVAS